jgi:hypothetical protein
MTHQQYNKRSQNFSPSNVLLVSQLLYLRILADNRKFYSSSDNPVVIPVVSKVIFRPSIYCCDMPATLYKTQAVKVASKKREALLLFCKQAGGYCNT